MVMKYDEDKGWNHLDKQLSKFSIELINEVGIDFGATDKIATIIYSDTLKLSPVNIEKIKSSSPVSLKDRYES